MSAEEEKDVAPETAGGAESGEETGRQKSGRQKSPCRQSAAPRASRKQKRPRKKAAGEGRRGTSSRTKARTRPRNSAAAKKRPSPSSPRPATPTEAKEAAKAKPAKEPAPKAAPRAKAGGAKPARRRVVSARARYVRTSARKARMVCGHLRGKSVAEARAILAFTPREVARDWSKLLESAVANAESNHELLEDDLIVREAYADEGPTIKRFRPRAMGRATPIRKRTSHLTITLTAAPENGSDRRKG